MERPAAQSKSGPHPVQDPPRQYLTGRRAPSARRPGTLCAETRPASALNSCRRFLRKNAQRERSARRLRALPVGIRSMPVRPLRHGTAGAGGYFRPTAARKKGTPEAGRSFEMTFVISAPRASWRSTRCSTRDGQTWARREREPRRRRQRTQR